VSWLAPVTPSLRESIAREFDDRGPDVCLREIENDLRLNNPELLEMAAKCAYSLGDYRKVMIGFGMFYRLLLAPATPGEEHTLLSPLPRVTPQTREMIVRVIDRKGPETFTMDVIDEMETDNPELLQMAHRFASRQRDYLSVMQGFVLLYRSVMDQFIADRTSLN
jgi:hypothetical protein